MSALARPSGSQLVLPTSSIPPQSTSLPCFSPSSPRLRRCVALAFIGSLLGATLCPGLLPLRTQPPRSTAAMAASPSPSSSGGTPRFRVGGHRGMGQNRAPPLERTQPVSQSQSDPVPALFNPGIRENTVESLHRAAEVGADFVEFDVQVTRDGHPVLFHDNLLWTLGEGGREESHKVPDMTLEQFQAVNTESIPQGKLLRKRRDGSSYVWRETEEGPMPSLEDVFEHVPAHLGFNIELKFPADDSADVSDADVAHMLDHVVPVVKGRQGQREVFFSSFVPQAVVELKRREPGFQVLFLTVGRPGLFRDARMNSIKAAIALARENLLDGIVPEVVGLMQDQAAISAAKGARLKVITWGDQNNDKTVVSLQKKLGVDAVIADAVKTAVAARDGPSES